NGDFKLSFEAEHAEYFDFFAGNKGFRLYLKPGDSIYLTANLNNLPGTTQISGDRVNENTFAKHKIKVLAENNLLNYNSLTEYQVQDFLSKKSSTIQQIRRDLDSMSNSLALDEQFVAAEKEALKFKDLELDFLYPIYYKHYNAISPDSSSYPYASIDDRILNISLDNPDLIFYNEYNSVAQRKLYLIRQNNNDQEVEESADAYLQGIYEIVDANLNNQSVKEYLKFIVLNDILSFTTPHEVEQEIDAFLSFNNNPVYQKIIAEEKKAWDHLKPGSSILDVEFENSDGSKTSLADLNGKIVYIDLWATWCKPCIAEHPFWDALVEEYKNKPIAFVAISVDQNKEAWKNYLSTQKLSGTHWYLPESIREDFAEFIKLDGIPRYLLLDTSQRIINSNAMRPSGNIRETLDKALSDLTS
ncbi:MAG: TlpA disulfide reductase family protein, partial [Flavobacteriaceae bacterium]|nr:TlpA disulfide reductase family protein [Flavobacteriaceae bacterium]